MKSRDFCYWMQGFIELRNPGEGITETQAEIIKDHLNMVFIHEIDPSYPASQQQALTTAHNKDTNIRC
jgi:hypothetical protein